MRLLPCPRAHSEQGRDLRFKAWLPQPLPAFPHCLPVSLQESAAKCFFGDRCRFLHDVSCYLETKPADLGPRCVLFETYGRCPYGVTCRFAGAHLGPKGQNLVQEEVVQAPPVRNSLDKALQQQLRKRKIHFERAEQALHQLGKGHLPGSTPSATVPMVPGVESAQQAPLGPCTGTPPSSPMQTCGPLTDEDIVRLRSCEKRRVRVTGFLLRMLAVWGAERAQPQRVRAKAAGEVGKASWKRGHWDWGFDG